MNRLLLAGNVPYLAVILLCAAFLALGAHLASPTPRIAIVERGAVVLEAVLEMPGATKEELRSSIELPTKEVLQKYRSLGYLVIDSSRDDAGNMMVAAMPESVTDITGELRAAVRRSGPPVSQASVTNAPIAAAASAFTLKTGQP